MTIDVPPELASYPLERAVEQLEVRANQYGSLFRCITCREPLAQEPDHVALVFDPHFGHDCGESGPILVGLTHEKCRIKSVYPYSQKDLPRFIHHQHGFYGRRSGDAPTCVVVSTLLFDVLWVQPDGGSEEPWLSASLANGSSRITEVGELSGRVASAAGGWIAFGQESVTVSTGGQTVFDFVVTSEMETWRAQAEQEGSMVFIQSSLQPQDLDPEAGQILEPSDLEAALNEIVQHEPLAAVSLPVRTATSQGKGAGRNDSCPCLSGTKFKRCCG